MHCYPYYIRLIVACLGLLTISLTAAVAVTVHSNFVYLNLLDINNNPLVFSSATYENVSQDVTSDQNPDNSTPQLNYYEGGSSQLSLLLNVGRHRDSSVADSFQTAVSRPNATSDQPSQPNVLTLGINDNDNTYYCQDMNFWFKGHITIQLAEDEFVTLPNLAFGQSSNSFWKIFLSIVDAIGATAWDVFLTGKDFVEDDAWGVLMDGTKSFKDAISGAQSISASFDNFWLTTQSLAPVDISQFNQSSAAGSAAEDDPEDLFKDRILSANPFSPPSTPTNTYPIIVSAYYQNTSNNQSYAIPVYISAGSNDHSFNLQFPYPFPPDSDSNTAQASGTPEERIFYDAPQVSDNFFLDPSIGIFQKQPGSTWFWSLNLGWCLPSGDYAPDLWIYAVDEDDWYYISKDNPGALYKNRTTVWYFYDSNTVRHIPSITISDL